MPTVVQLKKKLKAQGLSTDGKKAALQARLKLAEAAAGNTASDGAPKRKVRIYCARQITGVE